MNRFFKLKTAVASAAVLLLGAGSAYASFGVTGGNFTTGSSTSNTNTWSISDTNTFGLTNVRTQSNSLGVSAATGGNAFGSNTEIGNISTGGVNGMASIMTTPIVNPVIDLSMLGGLNGMADLSNDTTGPGSANSNTLAVSHSTTVGITNSSTITNGVSVGISTGGNSVSSNTVVGSFSGGDANYSVAVSNPGSGLGIGGIIMPVTPSSITVSTDNTETGPSSSNSNTTALSSTTAVGITNVSSVTNSVGVSTSTGGNSVAGNTSVGDVSTGGSTVNVSIAN